MADDSGRISRREFLNRFVMAAAGVVAAAIAVPLIGYFVTPSFARKGAETAIPVASTSSIPAGAPTFVTYQQTIQDGWVTGPETMAAWIVTTNGSDFTVFEPHCPHLGCLYAWNPGLQEFECPCHASIFDINGKVLAGPAPRPLDQIPFRIENGQIVLLKAAVQ